MSNIQLDVRALESAIANLLIQYPEIGEDETLRADMFEGLGLNDTIEKLLESEREAKTMVAAIKERMAAQAERKARYERQQEAFRSLIQHLMERADLRKLTLPEATLSIAHRKGTPQVTDPAALPDECIKLERKPVMDIIRAWVEAGNVPEGVALGNGKTSLTIRSK